MVAYQETNRIMNIGKIKLLAFDADDTLWDCQSYFAEVEKEYAKLLTDYATQEEVSRALFSVESANMSLLGYGSKAFTISLIENAVKMSHSKIPAESILKILKLGKSLLRMSGEPLPEVVDTLQALRHTDSFHMVVFTKGELLDQQNKMTRSGLRKYFDDVVVVADKTQDEYSRLCRSQETAIEEMMMIGNSFRSDISPVIEMGGWAAYIPFHTVWKHEVTKEYDHERLFRLTHFGQLTDVLCHK